MNTIARRVIPIAVVSLGLVGLATMRVLTHQQAQQQQSPLGYEDTPMQPNGKWHVHDPKRPQPRVVTPGPAGDPVPPPSDAILLVGKGADLSAWQMSAGGAAVSWPMKDGILQSGKGMIRTKEEFSDVQVHIEFATPSEVKGNSQGRGNSGVFLAGVFEIQVLDSYQNQTYPDGQASAMYGQYPPLVNASRPPGQWQTYDIVFMAPRFSSSGQLEKPASATVFHNGIVVHNATAFWGPTQHKMIGKYLPAHAKGPLQLQDHGNPVRFRNVWIRPLKGYDEQ
jgi:hypothetical protein